MNIVIIGAGSVGRYIAAMFAKKQYNVILVDKNGKKLQEAAWQMDAATRQGSGTDLKLLEDLLEFSPDLFIALTNDDESNLVACSIAKNLGYPKTIARVKDHRYLNRKRLDFGRMFNVDYFVGPELLAAYEINKYLMDPGSLAMESFAHGAVQLRSIIIPNSWKNAEKRLADLSLPTGLLVVLIQRQIQQQQPYSSSITRKVIFPHGNDHILPGDEVTIIGEAASMANCYEFFGISTKKIESVAIVGGSLTGYNLAKILEQQGIRVLLIEQDEEKCHILAEQLPKCSIVNHDGTDLDFLIAERIGSSDAFVACTRHDEVNFLAALAAKEAGCKTVVLQLANTDYTPLTNQLGISFVVSPRISAANRILSLAHSGRLTSVVSLSSGEAEIMEINVSMNSKVVGIPISQLGALLPKDFLIAMIQNRGRIMIAHGNRIISPGDTVIVVSNPKHMHELEKIF